MKPPYVPKHEYTHERNPLASVAHLPGAYTCDPGMSFKSFPKLDASEIDARILGLLPGCHLDEGLRYARWAVVDGIKDPQWVASTKAALKADSSYVGMVLGKPLTILMFGDLFPEMPTHS